MSRSARGRGGRSQTHHAAIAIDHRGDGAERLGRVDGFGETALHPERLEFRPRCLARVGGQHDDRQMAAKSGLGGSQEPDIQLRKNFDAALFWDPALKPDEQGKIRVEVPFSDSLTTWRATARGVTEENHFGEGKAKTRTLLPLVARLPLPDVLIEGDSWEVAGTVQNNGPEAREVTVTLNVEGSFLGEGSAPATQTQWIEGGGQGLFVWKLQSGEPGTARFEMVASTGEYGDRIQRSVPIQEHGMDVIRTLSDYATGETGTLRFELPADRQKASTTAEVVAAPTAAATVLEGFGYLL